MPTHKKPIERYFFFGLLATTVILVGIIFRPFLSVLVAGISLAVVFHPLYTRLLRLVKHSWIAAGFSVALVSLICVLPISVIGTIIFEQAQDVYSLFSQTDTVSTFLANATQVVQSYIPIAIQFDVNAELAKILNGISQNIAPFFSATLSTVFTLILIIVTWFYFLKDGAKWREAVFTLSPLSDADTELITEKIAMAINGVIKGYLLIALAQGVLMGVGLAIFGVPSPALWGVVAAIVSMVPMLGTAFVSIPAVIFLFATGNTFGAVGLLIWSMSLVGMIDNLLSPFVLGSRIELPPLLVLFAVLGGLAVFGPSGLLIGPILVSLLYSLIALYKKEFSD